MEHHAVIVEDGKKVMRFAHPGECARMLGLNAQTVANRCRSHVVGKSGMLFYFEEEGRPQPRPFNRARAIVAISPSGVRIRFRTITECGAFFGKGTGNIYYALDRSGTYHRWMLQTVQIENDANAVNYEPWMKPWMFEAINLDRKVLDAAGIRMSAEEIRSHIGRRKSERKPGSDRPRSPYLFRQDVVYGFFEADLDPAICPACQMVLSGPGAYKHLQKCLLGHQWKLRPDGVIEMKISDEAPDDSEFLKDTIYSGRKRGKEVSM